MAARNIKSLAPRATFIFSGTVERMAAATLSAATVDDATAIVRVEQVFRVPEVVADQSGRSITVQLRKADLDVGDHALFFANGWLYGDSIAVTEVDRVSSGNPDDLGESLEQSELRARERDLRERISAASLVVAGRVGRIVPWRKGARASESEHDPNWFVAELEVESVEKGRYMEGRPVRLAFPASDDVQWYWRPKPRPGQEGIWILHRDQQPAAPKGTFTALDPPDFQPLHELDHVRHLIASAR